MLGGPSSAWNYIYRNVLSTFANENKNISLELKTHSSENTISKVLDGVIDVGISYTKPTHPNLLIHKHIEDHFKFVSRIQLNKSITIKDLKSKKFIINNCGDALFECIMEFTGVNHLPALSMNQTAIVLKMLEEHDYFTLLPSMIAQPFINDKILHYLESEFDMPPHHIYIFTPKDLKKEATINKVLDLLKKQAEKG